MRRDLPLSKKIDLLSLLKQREDMLQSSVNRTVTAYTMDEYQVSLPTALTTVLQREARGALLESGDPRAKATSEAISTNFCSLP